MDDEAWQKLHNFFGSYFSQDWPLEADTPDEMVAIYLSELASKENLVILGKSILEYSEKFATDGELEEHLFSDLSCYYSPSLDGLSAKVWLKRVAHQLLEAARQ